MAAGCIHKPIRVSGAEGRHEKSFRNPFASFGGAALLLSLSFLALNADPQSPDTQAAKGDSILGERIAGGIVFEGKLWLRGIIGSRKDLAGGLISLGLADGSRQVHFERG